MKNRRSDLIYRKKKYDEFELYNNKQSVENLLIERAVRMAIQILYDKRLFDNYNKGNAHEVFKDYLLTERRRPDLEESK